MTTTNTQTAPNTTNTTASSTTMSVSSDFVMEGMIASLTRRKVSGKTEEIQFFSVVNRPGAGIKNPEGEWVRNLQQLNRLLQECRFLKSVGYYGRFAEKTLVVEAQLPEGWVAFPANLPTRVVPMAYLPYIRHCRMFDAAGNPKMACLLDVCPPPPANKPWQAVIGGKPTPGAPVPLGVMLNFNVITLKFNKESGEMVNWLPGKEKFVRGPLDCDEPWVLIGRPHHK